MKRKTPLLVIGLLFLLYACDQQPVEDFHSKQEEDSPLISISQTYENEEQVWSGEVLVEETVVIPKGTILRIEPGTIVRFKPYRGYKGPGSRVGMEVYGTIIADGTPDQPIYFTSAAEDPLNGDWGMLRVIDSEDSFFNYVVVEFAQQGLNFWDGAPKVFNSVVRWNNWEGIYFESYAEAEIFNTHIYQNGYNGIAAEQFNHLVIENCLIERNGTHGVHIDASDAAIIGSHLVKNRDAGISVDNGGSLTVQGTLSNENGIGIDSGEGENILRLGNVIVEKNGVCDICTDYDQISDDVEISDELSFHFIPDMSNELGYTPGDQEKDQYAYIYDEKDETREIVRRIGENLGLTWAIAWDGEAIWTAALWAEYYRLDPDTGEILEQFTGPGSQVWGLTFDGESLWSLDFAEKMIYQIDPNSGDTIFQFPSPDPDNGCKGMTWDGEYLYIAGWASEAIYKMDREGNLVDTITMFDVGGGGLAWDGAYFWLPAGGRIVKTTKEGNVVGWIYSASEGTWDMTWGDGLLWASQRTNENWPDAKIYGIHVVDDHTD